MGLDHSALSCHRAPPPRVVVMSGKVIVLKLKYARMTVFQNAHTDKEKALEE